MTDYFHPWKYPLVSILPDPALIQSEWNYCRLPWTSVCLFLSLQALQCFYKNHCTPSYKRWMSKTTYCVNCEEQTKLVCCLWLVWSLSQPKIICVGRRITLLNHCALREECFCSSPTEWLVFSQADWSREIVPLFQESHSPVRPSLLSDQ